MWNYFRSVVAASTLASGSVATQAQVITDGSVGAQLRLSGTNIEIEQAFGTRTGDNLFHSFEAFNIEPGGIVTFTGAADIDNVISRVTGGEASLIQGTLRSQVGNADFYFINPAGVTFGEGGSVDVPASFHLSTADELRFSDGTTMDTTNPTTNTLTIAAPEDFGFLGNDSGAIDISGANIEITGGELSVTGNELVINDATLSSVGNIDVDMQGRFSLENGGQIFTETSDDSDAGNINVTANQLNIDGEQSESPSAIYTISTGTTSGLSGNAGNIVLDVEDILILNGGFILNRTSGTGQAGMIELTAGQLRIDGQQSESFTGISADTTSAAGPTFSLSGLLLSTGADAGNVVINMEEAIIVNGGSIESATYGAGNAGRVELTTGALFIDRQGSELFTGIRSDASSDADGFADAVDVTVSGKATIANGGIIRSSGIVRVTASQLHIDGQQSQDQTGIQTDNEDGNSAGTIVVHIFDQARIENGGRVSSSGLGIVTGGVRFNARNLIIDGPGSGIFSEVLSGDNGNGATIDVTITEQASIINGGVITSGFRNPDPDLNPDASGPFNGGDVQVTANRLLVDGQDSGIFSSGRVGNNGGNVLGGRVVVLINEQTVIQNGGAISSEGGGVVSIESAQGSIELLEDATVTSAAENGGFGRVVIATGGEVTINNASVTTESAGGGGISPSSISITAGTLDIRHGEITTEASAPEVEAGGIQIQSEVLVLEEAFIQANAGSGMGGTITVTSDVVIPFADKLNTESTDRLSANSGLGNVIQAVAEDGVTVSPTVNAPDTDINAGLTELNTEPENTAEVASNPCASFSAGAPSSLIEAGRGALPTDNYHQIYEQIYQQIKPSNFVATTEDPEHRNTDKLFDSDASRHINQGCRYNH